MAKTEDIIHRLRGKAALIAQCGLKVPDVTTPNFKELASAEGWQQVMAKDLPVFNHRTRRLVNHGIVVKPLSE